MQPAPSAPLREPWATFARRWSQLRAARERWTRKWWDSVCTPEDASWEFLFGAWIFGVIAPEFVLFLDTRIPTPGSGGPVSILPFRPYSALLIHGWVLLMALWLMGRKRSAVFHGLFAGPLAAGAAFAFAVGIALLPLSLLALMFGIGVLGLVPLATGAVFRRAACIAWKAGRGRWSRGRALRNGGLAALALLAGTAILGRMSVEATRHCEAILVRPDVDDGDRSNAERVLRTLRLFPGISLREGRLMREALSEDEKGTPLRPELRTSVERIEGANWDYLDSRDWD